MFKFYNIVLPFDFSRNAFSHLTHNILGLVWGRNQTEEMNVPKGKKKAQHKSTNQISLASVKKKKKSSVYHNNSKAQNILWKQILAL